MGFFLWFCRAGVSSAKPKIQISKNKTKKKSVKKSILRCVLTVFVLFCTHLFVILHHVNRYYTKPKFAVSDEKNQYFINGNDYIREYECPKDYVPENHEGRYGR